MFWEDMALVEAILVCFVLQQCLAKQKTGSMASRDGQGVKKIWIESMMLQSQLHWEPLDANSSARYTVVCRPLKSPKWIEVTNCVGLSTYSCNVTSTLLLTTSTYELSVSLDTARSYTKKIKFIPECDTKLLPPDFAYVRYEKSLFVRPTTPLNPESKRPISEQITFLEYQVKYWPQQNEALYKLEQAPHTNSEITLQVPDKEKTYCLSLRLYIGEFCMSGNPWSKAVCLEPVVQDTKESKPQGLLAAITSSLAVMALIGILLCVLHRARRWHRFINKVGPIPDALEQTFDKRPSDSRDSTDFASASMPEIIDKLEKYPFIFDTLSIDSKFSPTETKSSLSVTSNSSDQTTEQASVRHQRAGTKQRKSRGYHSGTSGNTNSLTRCGSADDIFGAAYVPVDAVFADSELNDGGESYNSSWRSAYISCSEPGLLACAESFPRLHPRKEISVASESYLVAETKRSITPNQHSYKTAKRSRARFGKVRSLSGLMQLSAHSGVLSDYKKQQAVTASGVSLPNPAYCSRVDQSVPDILYLRANA